jgi:hypothetical protein
MINIYQIKEDTMIRRNALKTLVSLSALGFLMLRHPHKSFAGSSGDSDSNHSGGGSSSRSSGVNHESSYDNDYENGSSSSSNRYSSSSLSGEGKSSSNFGSNGYISGSIADNTENQNELIEELKQRLDSDGLETVTPENLKSVLEAFI